MKKLVTRVIAILLTVILSSTNFLIIGSYGISYALNNLELLQQAYTTNNAKEIETAQVTIEGQLTKYVPYNIEEKYGVMLQAKINSGILNNTLPIKETKLTIKVPEINGKKPTTASVILNSAKLSNAQLEEADFNNENYSYNQETGIVTITIANSQNIITVDKNEKDEYLVNFTFEDKETYDYVNENNLDSSIEVQSEIKVYNSEETTISKTETIELKQEKKLGNITDFYVTAQEYISKGQIYANCETENKKETSFKVNYEAFINNASLTENVTLKQISDELEIITSSANLKMEEYIYNKTITISPKVFDKILGTEGIIEILNKDNEKIAVIDKNTPKDENGNYKLDISSRNEANISIKTSKPILEGKISLDTEKAIKTNLPYSRAQLEAVTKLHIKMQVNANNVNETKLAQISLKEPKNVVELSINKTELSNTIENQNVEIKAILDTSNVDNALFKDPILKITLPNCINKVKINSYDIVMGNGLKIKEFKAENKNGSAVLTVKLEGTQTEYTIGAEYKGTIVVINMNLGVKPLTPTIKEKILLTYTNGNERKVATAGEENQNTNTIEQEVNFNAPTGVMIAHGISNHKENAEPLLETSNQTLTAILDTSSKEQTATFYGKIVNNCENGIENVKILGRFPTQGNRQIDESTELGSTFSMKISSDITLNGTDSSKYTIYYTENGEATKDLSDANNGWSKTRMQNAKSYLIETKEHEMEVGETVEFSYKANIPANLEYNQKAYETYKVYYDNNSEIGKIAEAKTAPKIEATTGEGPELQATITSTAETIREGQVVKMKLEVTNTGTVKAENVEAHIPLPENAEFAQIYPSSGFGIDVGTTKTLEFENIEPGETVTKSYYIRIKRQIEEIDTSEDKQIIVKNTATVTADNIEGIIQAEECDLRVTEGLINIDLVTDIPEEQILLLNNTMEYIIKIDNISGQPKIENIDVTIKIPKELDYLKAIIANTLWTEENGTQQAVSFDEENNVVKINLNEIETTKRIIVKMKVKETTSPIISEVTAIINNNETEKYYSNIAEHQIASAEIKTTQLISEPETVKEGEKIKYSFKIKNEGKTEINAIKIQDQIPKGLEFEKIEYSFEGKNITGNIDFLTVDNMAEITITEALEPNETVKITIITTAGMLSDKNTKEIKNQVLIIGENFETIKTNIVTNYIEYNSELHENENNNDNPQMTLNKITGTAWLDSNKNGQRENTETLLPNMDILLINKKDNTIVKDPYTGEEKRVKTNSNGQYEINNVPTGEYIVIFDYNASRYALTTYKAKDVEENINSDAIDIYITLDGIRRLAGISDVIKISENNVRNIDIGVYEVEKFDLQLDKYITKTTLSTPTIGTKTTNYDNKKITKVEVLKGNLGKSNVIIEYKIVITNKGSVPGYAKKIVDYLPKGVSFYSEINKDWYLSDNGNVYNTSLENTLINPGESKEVTLTLSQTITQKSLGTLSNTAEIYESYNELGLQDANSKEGNRAENENDMSKADVVLTIVTGKLFTYGTIAVTVIAILAIGIFEIKRKVLNKKERRTL